MADNYLEKKMQDMQTGKIGVKKFIPSKKYLEKLKKEQKSRNNIKSDDS